MPTVSHMPYLKQRHIYRVFKAVVLANPTRFPYSRHTTFRQWLDLPF